LRVPYLMCLSKKISGFLLLPLWLLFSCHKDAKELSPQEIEVKVEAIVKQKEEKLRKESLDDLNHRLSIELKPKIDSILKRTAQPNTELPELDTLNF
jgi:hypothetical protein